MKSCGARSQQRSDDFNGNTTKKLLSRWKSLKDYICADAMFYVNILGAFNSVVSGCFGYALASDYKERLEHFEWILNYHDILLTPVLHIIVSHVPEFIEQHNMGLGYHSEQTAESVHHSWEKFFENFKCSIYSNDLPSSLLRAIVSYNSQHM